MSTALGNHILVEFMNCDPHVMNDVAAIERDMVGAAQKAGATVINSTFHHFSPYGVSGVVVIQESHLAIHTWPEYGYAAVDLFTCGEMNAWISFDHLKECFGAKSYSALEMKRGSVNLLQRNDFDISSAREKAAEWRNPEFYTRNVWFTDKDEDQALSLRFTGDVFVDVQSPFQRVRILESLKYGKMLALDDMVMTTEKDEFHYHEMISHPAMFMHPNPKNVLVIGGGDVIETLEDMVWRHSLSEKVFFKGKMPIEELVKYTSVADLGVSLDKDTNLNYRYSLPNKLFDYIQCGIPVFSSNLVELKNVIEKYKVGYIASNHEPNYLAKRLTEIFEDEVTLAQYKANARKAAEELCWEKEKIKFEQIIKLKMFTEL